MDRLLVTAVVVCAAALVALLVRQRRPVGGPTQTGQTPDALDRSSFIAPDSPWLLAVFSSATCMACADVLRMAQGFESANVAVQDIDFQSEPDVHKRYSIDSVPTTVIADRSGVVRGAWIGPLSIDDRDELHRLISQP